MEEFNTLLRDRNHPWIDTQLDTAGIALDKAIYCGKCMAMMYCSKPGVFVCPVCHAKHTEMIISQ